MTARIAILGTGWGARTQAPIFRHAGFEVAAVWGRTAERARAAASEIGVRFATADAAAAVGRDDVDLVVVSTPPHLHAELSIAALDAGKHVLCEKPTALDAEEAERMAEAARSRRELLALIDHELRFLPSRRRMRDLFHDGYVGEPLAIDGHWRSGARLDRAWAWSWWSDSELGGGILGAAGSHFVDSMSWLLGRRPTAVAADLRPRIQERADAAGSPRPVTADEHASLLLSFGPVPGTLRVTSVAAGPRHHQVSIAGSEGRLAWENGALVGYRAGDKTPEPLAPADEPLPLEGLRDSEWTRGTLRLAEALGAFFATGERGPLEPAATFEDGLAVQRTLDAARRSHDERRWVDIPE